MQLRKPEEGSTPVSTIIESESANQQYSRGFNPSSVLCSHYTTWERHSQEHNNYRVCCPTPPQIKSPPPNRKFFHMKRCSLQKCHPVNEQSVILGSSNPSGSFSSTEWSLSRSLIQVTTSGAQNRGKPRWFSGLGQNHPPPPSRLSPRVPSTPCKLGKVPSVSPEDTDLLLHDYKTLKFFLCATRGPPPSQQEMKEEEEEEEMSPPSPIFNRRPTTQPNLTKAMSFSLSEGVKEEKSGGGRQRRRNAITLESTFTRRKPSSLKRRFSSYVQNSRVSIAFKHKVGPVDPNARRGSFLVTPAPRVSKPPFRPVQKSRLSFSQTSGLARFTVEEDGVDKIRKTVKQTVSIRRCKSEIYDDVIVSTVNDRGVRTYTDTSSASSKA